MTDKKDRHDHTSAQRATNHLRRLAASNGKRLPVDLPATHVKKLGELMAAGYATTAVGVIRKAIDDAHAGLLEQVETEAKGQDRDLGI